MPPCDTQLVVPHLRCPTCTTRPRHCPTHGCTVLSHSPCSDGRPQCITSAYPCTPLALTAPTAHPRHLHHVPVAPIPHQRVIAPTNASIPPPMRHAPQDPHRRVPGLTWGETPYICFPRYCTHTQMVTVFAVMGMELENQHRSIPVVNPT